MFGMTATLGQSRHRPYGSYSPERKDIHPQTQIASPDMLCGRCLGRNRPTSIKIAPRMVSLSRKKFLFFASDHACERGTLLYSLLGICKLNSVAPEGNLRYLLDVIAGWPGHRKLLHWHITLPTE